MWLLKLFYKIFTYKLRSREITKEQWLFRKFGGREGKRKRENKREKDREGKDRTREKEENGREREKRKEKQGET